MFGRTVQEIDYRNEAKNAIRFRNQFKGIEWIKVSSSRTQRRGPERACIGERIRGEHEASYELTRTCAGRSRRCTRTTRRRA